MIVILYMCIGCATSAAFIYSSPLFGYLRLATKIGHRVHNYF